MSKINLMQMILRPLNRLIIMAIFTSTWIWTIFKDMSVLIIFKTENTREKAETVGKVTRFPYPSTMKNHPVSKGLLTIPVKIIHT